MTWQLHTNGDYFQFVHHKYQALYSTRQGNALCCETFNPIFVKQVHSDIIVILDTMTERTGDGIIARQGPQAIGIKVADCLPVYLFNDTEMCILHCGWRSIIKGIARKAAQLLGQYHYVLGASIGPCCYSVDEDVALLFQQKYKNAIALRNGKYFLDLKAAVVEDLGEKHKLAALDLCTKCHPEFFYSYRRGDKNQRNVALLSLIDAD